MSQTPFRTVDFRTRQSQGKTNLTAPDRTKQTSELERQQRSEAEALQTVIGLNQNLATKSQDVVLEAEINNQRLIQAQLSNNRELALKARELRQQQGLADQKMLDDFDRQIEQLRNAQEITASQIKEQQTIARNAALSDFGQQFIKFSTTLAQEQADRVNEANRKIMAEGMMDGFLKFYGEENTAVDQAQDARVEVGARLDQEATKLEQEGKTNDATALRSSNGFYLYGYQEGLALKAASEFPAYLAKKKTEFLEANQVYGAKDADLQMQSFIRNATLQYLNERNLQSVPPEVLNKYLARTILSTQAKAAKEFNDANAKITKQSAIGKSIYDLRNLALPASNQVFNNETFRQDAFKIISGLYWKDPENFAANLKTAYEGLKGDSQFSGDIRAVQSFITLIENVDFFAANANEILTDFPEFIYKRDKRIKGDMNEAANEQADQIIADAMQQAAQLNDPEARIALQERLEQQAASLPSKQQIRVLNQAQRITAINKEAQEAATLRFMATNPSPAQIEAYAQAHPEQGPEWQAQMNRYADTKRKVQQSNPDVKARIDAARATINGLKMTIDPARLDADPTIKDRLNVNVKLRQEEFDRRIAQWWNSGGPKDSASIERFLKGMKDLLEAPITPDVNRSQYNSGPASRLGIKPQRVRGTNVTAPLFTQPADREKARTGALGRLDPTREVYLTPDEIVNLSAQLENGTYPQLLMDLSSNSGGLTPAEFLNAQAKKLQMPGSVVAPPSQNFYNPQRGWRSEEDSKNFAISKGLSAKNAEAFSRVIMALSSGNPTAGGGRFGLFALPTDRSAGLYDYAQQQKKDPLDPIVQMEYMFRELKSFSGIPSKKPIWTVLTSRNPEEAQLIAAYKKWFPHISTSRLRNAIQDMYRN